MATHTHAPECADEQALLDGFHKLHTPEGYRAEFIEGEIVVSPPPFGKHEKIFSRITRQVIQKAAVEMDVSGVKGLELARGNHCTKNYVIPDGVFAPLELDLFEVGPSWMPSAGVAMVLEITSSNPDRDRGVKRHCYAKAGIPLYLLVDRADQQTTLFSEPDVGREDYQADVRFPFGKPLLLPAPFDFSLDTSDFS
ncbi:Uma2 family endonuclease [Actinomadura rudentiformis]|uniref:Uma2 family endonuclease n=1 Tax=Actinomadura rudentiformis TaxID=359158 RepID=A0A6H9YVY8_9ACTN|nr:Uma2 family endonuclease [Actinomadura rudentiformis]KAB2351437.1 Uma2 family endonuclease [Actinomadura rudentiformis]